MSDFLERVAARCIDWAIRLRLRGVKPSEQRFAVEITASVHRVLELIVGVEETP